MRKIILFLTFAFGILLAPSAVASQASTVSTAPTGPVAIQMHVTNDPHVGNPRYKNFNSVNFDFEGGWSDGSKANFRDAADNLETRLSWPPNIWVRDCTGNPGKCILVFKEGCNAQTHSCPYAEMGRQSGGPNAIWYHSNASPLSQRLACWAIVQDFGLHRHHGPGCASVDFNDWTTGITNSEEDALDGAYCTSCRGLEESDDGVPAFEEVTAPGE